VIKALAITTTDNGSSLSTLSLCYVSNKKYPDDNGTNHIRIAGDFLCVHRPWLTNWKEELPEDELNFYKAQSKCSTWV
jgi:hypothetical protein